MDDSIEQYLSQIAQIEVALLSASTNDEIKSLISLKNDLNELLELTKETQLINKKNRTIDDEFSLFMSEVNRLEGTSSSANDVVNNPNTNQLDTLVGTKCSALHTHTWGSKAYHNALICEVETNDDNEQMVRVLYTNPTHQEMIPCGFYLDGHCKFNEDKCRFSHGELVRYCDIKEYKPPDFTMLNKINCLVLVLRPEDKLWHKGTITFVDFDKKICRIKLEQNKKQEIESEFQYILPLENIHNNDSDLSSDNDEDDDYNNEIRDIRMIEQSLFTVPSDQMLGKWEQHTKGIGSKLMYKMGYVTGTGLGKSGEGIITPVTTQVLPQGKSLDYCMNLREQANGDKNLFSVEKKLQKIQKKQEQINIKAYEREKNKTDLFSFMNTKVFNKTINETETKEKSKKVDLKKETTKNLNVANFEISENIRKKEKEILQLNQSLKRHKDGTPVYQSIKLKLDSYKNELNILKNSEKSIAKEQNVRNNKNKLTIF